MKKIFIIFTLAFSHFFTVYGQEKDKLDLLFDKYQEVEGVTSIKIAKPMFGMLSSLDLGDADFDQIKPLLSKIKGLKVLIAEKPEDVKSAKGMQLSQISKDISSYLKNLNYSEIMTMNSGGARIKFMSAEEKNGVLDDLLLSIDNGGEESILMKLDGKLSMDDINKIINSSEAKTNSVSHTRSSFTSENTSSYLNGENRSIENFSGIQVSTGVNVVFKQETPTSVKVIADADKLKYVVTKVENGVLKVYVDNKGVKNLKFKNLSVNVSSPRIENIQTISGASFTAVNSIRENNLNIEASSGSNINGTFNVDDHINVSVDSGSNIRADVSSEKVVFKGTSGSNSNLKGTARTGIFEISSGASCKAENLRINNANVESSSGGSISIEVKDNLKVSASSGASVKYKGNPEIDSNISKVSGGSLKQIN
ncbi:DUF4252 domain-containing protein [Chryseobacterium sp. SSA4.19]|uniref:DUF4252 domain-containing protein n=1 Tax=Chryseobacterium sp. SSA4.19 TaxID=2919915 RepID=UPI001F4E5E30|nr:DUF4252 domain-containing protein [Chryseobacterium sp. SSA4.19]MCJ8153653.1 DUF4252 domain-containing protein [Chryseobacterium sp. SSA4.19]